MNLVTMVWIFAYILASQIQYLLIAAAGIPRVAARSVLDAPTISPTSLAECKGFLEFETENGTVHVSDSLDKTKILFTSVKMIGCGCFSIHSNKNGKGAIRYLSALGGRLRRKDLGMGRVRSIRRITKNCPV